MRSCYHCKQSNGPGPRELRPYGPGGADVCAECVFNGPPERRREAERQFTNKLGAAGDFALLTEDGPKRIGPRTRGTA